MSRLGVRSSTILRALATLAQRRGKATDPIRRILVAHYLLLGDTILLAPLLKALAARYPDAERVVLARPSVAPLFEGRPYGATVLPYDRRDAKSHRVLIDSGPYDLAIVPDDNRYAWLARAAGARRVIGFAGDRPGWKNLMLDHAVSYPAEPGAWADIVARFLQGEGEPVEVAPFVVGEWASPVSKRVPRPSRPYVVLHVGASTPLKQWPATRWRRVADEFARVGRVVVWSGGSGERGVLDDIGLHDGEIDLVGQLDLPQLWHLLAGATRLICPDTGIAHLARIVGVDTIALFGPGSTQIHGAGEFWADAPFEAITIDDFPCRNQDTLYRRQIVWVRRCGRRFDPGAQPAGRSDPGACSESLCMAAIETSVVLEALRGSRDDIGEAAC